MSAESPEIRTAAQWRPETRDSNSSPFHASGGSGATHSPLLRPLENFLPRGCGHLLRVGLPPDGTGDMKYFTFPSIGMRFARGCKGSAKGGISHPLFSHKVILQANKQCQAKSVLS